MGFGGTSGRRGVAISWGRRHADSGNSANRSGRRTEAMKGSWLTKTWTVKSENAGALILESTCGYQEEIFPLYTSPLVARSNKGPLWWGTSRKVEEDRTRGINAMNVEIGYKSHMKKNGELCLA
jgi:hypothetical protein